MGLRDLQELEFVPRDTWILGAIDLPMKADEELGHPPVRKLDFQSGDVRGNPAGERPATLQDITRIDPSRQRLQRVEPVAFSHGRSHHTQPMRSSIRHLLAGATCERHSAFAERGYAKVDLSGDPSCGRIALLGQSSQERSDVAAHLVRVGHVEVVIGVGEQNKLAAR